MFIINYDRYLVFTTFKKISCSSLFYKLIFFSEMAERHDAKAMLRIARDLVLQLQTLIENK